ncbi:MAG: glycosyltransferase, partial [Bacteroidia bacterium]|nr:glycosyltransferase [Bacteroidia bacterium]
MRPIKITFLTDRMIKGHGVDLVVDSIADGLSKKGYTCEVYANVVDETFANRTSYKIYKLPGVGLTNFLVLERRIRKFASFFNSRDTDLFIIQSFPFYSLIPLLKKPVLVVDHGVISVAGLPLKRKIYYRYLQYSQNLSYFRKAKRVIMVSNYLLNLLPNHIKKKASFIYNGIDHYQNETVASGDILRFRQSLGVSAQDVLLSYVGRLNLTNQPYKGLAELADIYQNVSINDEEFLKNQGILCASNVEEDMMPLIYSASDIYTTCSQWEGFDLPVGEAQYFGKPSICYNIGAHPEILLDGKTGFIVPEILLDGKTGFIVSDKNEFTQKVKVLAASKELREEMGSAAKEFIQKFTWQNSIDNYDGQIRKILNIGPDEKLLPPVIKAEETKTAIKKKVTVLIVNYNSSYPCLKECIDSFKEQTYKNIELLIFDNNSQNNTIDLIRKNYDGLKIINSEQNLGLGEAINQALKGITSKYVLISNFDVTYDKIAIEEFVEHIATLDNKYVGLAPKIKLYYQKEYIESVGVYIDRNFYLGYNGIGQLDLDQYN